MENQEINNQIPENDNNQTPQKKILFTILKIIISLVIIVSLVITFTFLYSYFSAKFNDVTIELGSGIPTIESFLKKEEFLNDSELITDLNSLDYSKTGEYNIELKYKNRYEYVKLNIVDTTAPKVEFQDLRKYIDYEINPDDFIVSKEDLSSMTTEIINKPELTNFGEYEIEVVVKDSSNNVTSKKCKLYVTRIVSEFTLELGNKLTKQDILLNYENDKEYIDQNDINSLNQKNVGTYKIDIKGKDLHEKAIINIVDTTGPILKLKKLSIYKDETIKDVNEFVSYVNDASGKDIKIELISKIDYTTTGKKDVIIEAEDKYGNKTTKTTTLTIKLDTTPPVINNLTTLTVKKNSNIDYKKNVKAIDAKDGNVEFTVDSSGVKINTAGTYYAKYTAQD